LPGAGRCVDDFPKRRRAGAGDRGRLDRYRTLKGRASSVFYLDDQSCGVLEFNHAVGLLRVKASRIPIPITVEVGSGGWVIVA
jgi:hypothetical protein